MTRDKVVLAYSGGLDTSVAIRWLQDRGLDVVALTVDVGQPGSLGAIKEKAHRLGAKAYVVDARREFAEQYVLPALAANAMYEGQSGFGLFWRIGHLRCDSVAAGPRPRRGRVDRRCWTARFPRSHQGEGPPPRGEGLRRGRPSRVR